jgi:hypothetical protein
MCTQHKSDMVVPWSHKGGDEGWWFDVLG